jgi:hypothetical protein
VRVVTGKESRVRSLRRRISTRLLESGTNLALDRREMWTRARQSSTRPLDPGFVQVMGTLELLSAVKIRLGMLIMPSHPPTFPDATE